MRRFISKVFNHFHHQLPTQRKLEELIWAQTFDFATRDSEWFHHQGLHPGRWAMGFPGLYVLYRVLSEVKPKAVLELGLGESSKLTFQYASHYPEAELLIIEQDDRWKEVFCRTIFDVSRMVRVLPLETTGKGQRRHHAYRDFASAVAGRKYDLVVVDGPWGSPRNSRSEVLDLIGDGGLADDFVILIDDADRRGEKDTIRQIKKLLSAQNRPFYCGFYRGVKDDCLICSPRYRFLTSL